MNALAQASLGLVAAALLLAVPAGPAASQTTASSPPATAAGPAMLFGMDAGSVAAQSAAGAKPDYGTFWVGPWTLSSGWGGPDGQLVAMRDQGVTPAIHLYYWGDDISKSCLENGCYSSLHKAQKDKAGWQKLTDQTVEHLNAKMQGKPVVIFLESEFNKGDVATYEPLDGYLEEKARQIKAGYPNAKIVMSLGNWNSAAWGTFDRTAAASDYVGIQGMRGSTRHSATDYATLYEGVLSGAKTLTSTFGKPVFLQDIALSTYPEPDYLTRQADEVGQFFTQIDDLQAAGVQAVVYRSWKDSPTMDTANWFGEAERHWGLTWAGNGTQKEAAKVWVDGVKAERAGTSATASPATTTSASATATSTSAKPATSSSAPTTAPATSATASASATATKAPAPYAVGFATGSGANANWVEVKVTASPAPAKVEVKAGDGAWKALRLRSTSGDTTTWGEAIAIAKGTPVSFRATAPDTQVATSAASPWLGAAGTATASATATVTATKAPSTTSATATKAPTSSAAATTTAGSTFSAKVTPKAVGNDWWVETAVAANQPVAKVEAKVGSTAGWTTLPKTDWGNYAKSVHAPNGTYVQFRVTSSSGATATSVTYVWG